MSISKTFQNSVLAHFLLLGICSDSWGHPALRFSESSGSLAVLFFWPRLLFWQNISLFLKTLLFLPDSTGCWTGSHRTAHGKERPSDTNKRHWRRSGNVREGVWKVKPGINQALWAASLCTAVFYFQSSAVQLTSLTEGRTVRNSVN